MTIQFDDRTKVSVVSAVCLLGLVIVLKNVLNVPAETLSRDVVFYILIYSVFGIVYPDQLKSSRPSLIRPLYWSVAIVVLTLAIVLLNAV